MKDSTIKPLKRLQALLLLAILLGASACSVKGNIEDLTEMVKVPRLGQQTGFVAGSQQNQVVNGYKVSASVGDYSTGMQQTVNGYTVYSSVQGNISAETVETVYQ